MRFSLRSAWHSARASLLSMRLKERWRSVKGPIGATITYLLQFAWHPTEPDVWYTPGRRESAHHAGSFSAAQEVSEAFHQAAHRHSWRSASLHFGGALRGAENGQNLPIPDRTSQNNLGSTLNTSKLLNKTYGVLRNSKNI